MVCMWEHLRPWADAVVKGAIPGFFTTANLRFPDDFPDGSRARAIGTPKGTLVCGDAFLKRIGAANSLHAGILLAGGSVAAPGDAAMRLALGPLASGGRLWFSALSAGERFVFSAESETALAEMEEMVKQIEPSARIERSLAPPVAEGSSVLRSPGEILARINALPASLRWRAWALLVVGLVCAGLCVGLSFTPWSWMGLLIGAAGIAIGGMELIRRRQ